MMNSTRSKVYTEQSFMYFLKISQQIIDYWHIATSTRIIPLLSEPLVHEQFRLPYYTG